MDKTNLYLNTKPLRLFVKAAVPGGISMLASSMYTVFDSIFVGKFLGMSAFAALGFAMPLVVINFALADLIGVGSSVPISIFIGRKEDDKANNYFTCASIMIVVTGILTGLALYFAAPLFMQMMKTSDEVARMGVQYIRIYALFSPVSTMMFAVDNFLRICGKIKTSMAINIAMSFGTILLEMLFILVLDMGIVGAALGANIAMFVCATTGFAMFLPRKLQLKLVRPKFDKTVFKQIYKNGSPAFLTNVAGRVFSVVMNAMLSKFGGEPAVGVYGIMMTVGGVVEQILYGMLDSLQPAIGCNYGAGKFDRVKKIEKYCLIAGAAVSCGFAVLIFAIPDKLALPFLEDLSLTDMAAHALRILSFTYLFRWLSHGIQSFFMALEKPLPSTCISVSSAFLFPLILIAVLYPFGLEGLWFNYTLTSVLTAALAATLLFTLKKKLFSVGESEPRPEDI